MCLFLDQQKTIMEGEEELKTHSVIFLILILKKEEHEDTFIS